MNNIIEFLFRFFGNATVKSFKALGLICWLSEAYKLIEQPFSLLEVPLLIAGALATHLVISIPEDYIKLWLRYSSPQSGQED